MPPAKCVAVEGTTRNGAGDAGRAPEQLLMREIGKFLGGIHRVDTYLGMDVHCPPVLVSAGQDETTPTQDLGNGRAIAIGISRALN